MTACCPSTSSTITATSSGLLASATERKQALIEEIHQLKREKNALILAHLYERVDVQDVADVWGDSLGLSQRAAETNADMIIFCGVHFMAETAKLLNPAKTVYLANPNAGCPMADMITAKDLEVFKAQHPGLPVLAYVNTSAEVKALSDYCCTSANASDVARFAAQECGVDEILFVPDRNLARYVQTQVPEVKITYYEGFCPTHMRMEVEDVKKLQQQYPEAALLVHPECDDPIKDLADFIGSTTAIVQAAKASDKPVFIVATEDGVSQRLAADCPEKLFITPTRASAICPNMKLTRLENIRNSLLGNNTPIEIAPHLVEPATRCIESMMRMPRGEKVRLNH